MIWMLFQVSYAATSSFEYMLDVMEIPKINQNGLPINEAIYQKYQLFVYGSPESIVSRAKMEERRRRLVDE